MLTCLFMNGDVQYTCECVHIDIDVYILMYVWWYVYCTVHPKVYMLMWILMCTYVLRCSTVYIYMWICTCWFINDDMKLLCLHLDVYTVDIVAYMIVHVTCVTMLMSTCWCVDVLMSTCWCVDACMLRCSKFLNFQDNYTVPQKIVFLQFLNQQKNFLLFSLSLNFTLVSFLIKLFYCLTCYVENRYEEATVIDSLFQW